MLHKFEIYNEKFKEVQAYLTYDSDIDKYHISIVKNKKIKHYDIFFDVLVKQGIYEVNSHFSRRWVEGRVFPPNRQGLQGMLDEMGMKEYNMFDILVYGNGRCQMDYSCIRRISTNTKE